MRAGRLPIDDQVPQFTAALGRNRTLTGVLARAAAMALPGWYLVAGVPVQIRNQARVHRAEDR